MRCRFGSPGPSPSANRRLLAEHEPGLAVGAERARITDRSALRRSKVASDARGKERRFLTPARRAVDCGVLSPTPKEAARSEWLPLGSIRTKADPHLGPLSLRPRPQVGPFPQRPRSYFSLLLLSPLRHFHLGTISLVCAAIETPSAWLAEAGGLAELRAPFVELTLEKAAYAAHAVCVVQHGTCRTTSGSSAACHVACNPTPVMRRSGHPECRACQLSYQATHLGPA